MAPTEKRISEYICTHIHRVANIHKSMLFKWHLHITKSINYKKHLEKLFLRYDKSPRAQVIYLSNSWANCMFTDTQSHAAFALQLLRSSPCLTRWCYWLYKNKDLPAKEKNVLNKSVLWHVLILLVTRCLIVFYTIKFLPFPLLLSLRLSLCLSNLILLSIGDTILVLFCTCLWNLLKNTTSRNHLTDM